MTLLRVRCCDVVTSLFTFFERTRCPACALHQCPVNRIHKQYLFDLYSEMGPLCSGLEGMRFDGATKGCNEHDTFREGDGWFLLLLSAIENDWTRGLPRIVLEVMSKSRRRVGYCYIKNNCK